MRAGGLPAVTRVEVTRQLVGIKRFGKLDPPRRGLGLGAACRDRAGQHGRAAFHLGGLHGGPPGAVPRLQAAGKQLDFVLALAAAIPVDLFASRR